MGTVKYPFVIYPAEEGGYVAEIPALKGCLAQGDSLNETLEELAVVEGLWLETAKRAGLKLPSITVEIDHLKELIAA